MLLPKSTNPFVRVNSYGNLVGIGITAVADGDLRDWTGGTALVGSDCLFLIDIRKFFLCSSCVISSSEYLSIANGSQVSYL
jgi:hypothetical protein